ncbi:protein-glucosylgalactosylhydroxylysine glucosidase-like [Acanthaster planci]|uniref:Protein-glucosylgalactosylhydroxylysine glucosidase n=1 Tax=Acanthaster planci TaxID=133434 RepID=A0A8B7YZS2_ACAPL|nr:protein-glucosylgalactosylhydroxylysine glucosidase-like [Acanthaster planci]XP_022098203.1 protein-glucosylgalactosylhydroxylysine glucosidase-like [Acanthaster planci]
MSLVIRSVVVILSLYCMIDQCHFHSAKRRTSTNMTNGCPCNQKYKDISLLPNVFESAELPTEACCLPAVGNGYLATVVYSDTIYVNGLYNGRGGASHRARIPSTAAIKISLPAKVNISKESYSLELENGTFHRKVRTDVAFIEQRIYAHQNVSYILVNEIVVTRTGQPTDPITLRLMNNTGIDSKDINFKMSASDDGSGLMYGNTVESETSTSSTIPIAVNWTIIPDTITLPSDQNTKTWTFITAIGPNSTVASLFQAYGSSLASAGMLYSNHYMEWQNKWNSGLMEVDNVTLSKAIYGSMYYILSSLPSINYDDQQFPFHFYGLSPGGLAHGRFDTDYEGHVFWDQETWMYPTMLMFHPKLGRTMLESRTYHLDAAKDLAKSRGYQGAEYPWEMAYTGAEVCPAEIYSLQEIHINGDISFAVQQYLHVTRDADFLKNRRGYEIISELAKYWASRVEYNSMSGNYEILGVKPPDEYHSNVNNSVYTNAVAQISLRLPAYAGKFINVTAPSSWAKIADKLLIVYDILHTYHPEYEGYNIGTKVKQADAILLGFPLNIKMDIDPRIVDLRTYAPVTDPDGPAMSWSMFSIGYGEIRESDKQDEMFQRNFKNIQQPFRIWTETASGSGAINFITGMGGFLQSVLFGYGGFRIHPDYLLFNFVLPQGTSKFTVRGLDYLGSEIDFIATEKTVLVTVTAQQHGAPNLRMETAEGVINDLVKGKTVMIHRLSWVTIRPL